MPATPAGTLGADRHTADRSAGGRICQGVGRAETQIRRDRGSTHPQCHRTASQAPASNPTTGANTAGSHASDRTRWVVTLTKHWRTAKAFRRR